MKKIKIIVATKGNGKDLPIIDTVNRIKTEHQIDMCVISNNTEGLSKVYNDNLDADYDLNVCVHDDVIMNDCLVWDKLSKSEYDVIGTAGGFGWKLIDPERPNIWTVASREYGMSGCVAHMMGEKIAMSVYGFTNEKTLTLDGHFLCLTRKAIEKGLKFDENFRFHYYDIDICFQAFKMGLTCGTSGVLLTHKSMGESVHQPEFMLAQNEFIRKWQLTK